MLQKFKRIASLAPAASPLVVAAGWSMDRVELLPGCRRQPIGKRSIEVARVIEGDTFVDDRNRHTRVVGMEAPKINTQTGQRLSPQEQKQWTPV